MHDTFMTHIGMEQDRRDSYDRINGSDGWVQIDGFGQQPQESPLIHAYEGFQYIQPISQPLPLQQHNYNRMPQPPTTGSHPTQPHLLPLLMPAHHPSWPSMLTNPAAYQPTMPIPSIPQTIKTKLPAIQTSTPRKTLTDDDRRRMCQYHEDNPNTKQVDIGAMFGVERSTVSKVLRQKEKYLFPEDRSTSPNKRQKGKFPDIDRALASWVRNSRKQGIPLTDAIIKEKAVLFARTVGNPESNQKPISQAWLEKFKQKNGISHGKLTRRASETNMSDVASNWDSASQTPNGISPTSPDQEISSPLSRGKSQDVMKLEGMEDFLDFEDESEYRQVNSNSSTSLSSAYTDATAPSSFSEDATSPSTPYQFSPELSCAPFLISQETDSSTPDAYQRPRSQTFPTLGVDPSTYMSPPQSAEPRTPKYQQPRTASSSALDGSMPPPFTSPRLQHRKSSGSMHSSKSASTAPQLPENRRPSLNTCSAATTPHEVRAAVRTLINYYAMNPFVNQDTWTAVVTLTEKLNMQNELPSPASITPDDQSFSTLKMEHV